MTLKEMKNKTFSLIEELYPNEPKMAEDEDVINKINGVVNQIQLDLMKYRKINAYKEIKITNESDKLINLKKEIPDLYQLSNVTFDKEIDYEMPNDELIKLPEDYEGNITIYYYKYPELVQTIFENDTDNVEYLKQDEEFVFELDNILLEIMPYGIAADLLKMDMISSYGKYFYERYLEMKNQIDSRRTSGIVKIVGGIDV